MYPPSDNEVSLSEQVCTQDAVIIKVMQDRAAPMKKREEKLKTKDKLKKLDGLADLPSSKAAVDFLFEQGVAGYPFACKKVQCMLQAYADKEWIVDNYDDIKGRYKSRIDAAVKRPTSQYHEMVKTNKNKKDGDETTKRRLKSTAIGANRYDLDFQEDALPVFKEVERIVERIVEVPVLVPLPVPAPADSVP